MKLKVLLLSAVAALVLLVAAPLGSAAPPTFSTVNCTLGSASWSHQVPSYAVSSYMAAMARATQHNPNLSCGVALSD